MNRYARVALCVWCGFTSRCFDSTRGLICRNCWVEIFGTEPEAA
jgi:hypothetical protein